MDLKNKKILIVNSGGINKTHTFFKANELGIDLYLLLTKKDLEEKRWVLKHVPRKKIIVSKDTNFETFIEDFLVFQSKNNIKFDGVTTFVEEYTFQASCVASALDKTFISPTAVINSSFYKYIMRERCKENGIKTPYYRFFKTLKELRSLCKNIDFPIVIKPHDGNHSLAVIKINNPKNSREVTRAFNLARNEMTHHFSYRFHGENLFLLEEFVEGSLISIDGIIQNGKTQIVGIAEYILSPDPLLVPEVNFIPPLDKNILKHRNEIYRETKKILKALKFDNCGFHCEMKIKGNKILLIEIGARIAGGPIAKGYSRAYGVDLAKAAYQISLNEPIKFKKTKNNYIMQKAVFAEQTSVFSEEKLNQLKKYPYVKDLAKFYKKGDLISIHGNQAEAIFYYCIEASTKKKLDEYIEEIGKLDLYKLTPIKEEQKPSQLIKDLKKKKNRLKKTPIGKVLKVVSDVFKVPFNYDLKVKKTKNISWFDFFE